MSIIFPTNVEKLDRVTKELDGYRALWSRHAAKDNDSGCRMVGIMVTRKERQQSCYARMVGLTTNQANHLYL